MREMQYTDMDSVPRYVINLSPSGSMNIRPSLVSEVINMGYQLSVKYGNTRIFLSENYAAFNKVVAECKAVESVEVKQEQ